MAGLNLQKMSRGNPVIYFKNGAAKITIRDADRPKTEEAKQNRHESLGIIYLKLLSEIKDPII